MIFRRLSLTVTLAAIVAVPVVAAQGRRGGGRTDTQPTETQGQAQPQQIVNAIYRALLGRDADPAGLADSLPDIQRGRTRQRVDAIVESSEFRQHVFGWAPERVLAQIYQGLLKRDPDQGSAGWLGMARRREYTDIVVGIIATPEFNNKLAATSAATPTPPAAAPDFTAAVRCQERVVEEIRNDLSGFVLIQFDAATTEGSTISGTATDVADNGRKLTYRCPTGANPTFVYDDGRRARSAPNEGAFSNDIVRSCQGEIRTKVQQQRNAANVVFESAGLMPNGTGAEAVRGLGFEKSASGQNGANFTYSCDMRGTQIMVSSFRPR